MKYTYKLTLDVDKDAWNWYGACNSTFSGVDWKKRISKDTYERINGKSKTEALKFLKPFLKQKYIDEKQAIDNQIDFFEKSYKNSFEKACIKIAELTGKELYLKDFTIFLTTFPRGPYDYGKGHIWKYIGWKNPIVSFMHELLHIQFHKYWQNDNNSPVSKLSEDEFHFLKESLTVILDEDLIPLIEFPDNGYEIHKDFRSALHKFWKETHDFDKLVDYGLRILPGYI